MTYVFLLFFHFNQDFMSNQFVCLHVIDSIFSCKCEEWRVHLCHCRTFSTLTIYRIKATIATVEQVHGPTHSWGDWFTCVVCGCRWRRRQWRAVRLTPRLLTRPALLHQSPGHQTRLVTASSQSCGSVTFWYGSGSVPLINGYGAVSNSGSCYFRQWPSRWQQKKILLDTFETTFTSFFKDIKS